MTTIERPNETPLSPLRFLQRSAEVFGQKTAIIHGDRPTPTREFAAEAAAARQALQEADRARRPGRLPVAEHPGTADRAFRGAARRGRADRAELAAGRSRDSSTSSSTPGTRCCSSIRNSSARSRPSATGSLRPARDRARSPTRRSPSRPGDRRIAHRRLRRFPRSVDAAQTEPLLWGVDDEQRTIAINYTSGTTGKPKGVMYSHRGAYLNSLGETFHNGFTGDTKYLWTLPMFHCNGWCTPWASPPRAAPTCACARSAADAIWDAIDTLGVTNLCGAPTVCSTIADAPQAHPPLDPAADHHRGRPRRRPTVIGQLGDARHHRRARLRADRGVRAVHDLRVPGAGTSCSAAGTRRADLPAGRRHAAGRDGAHRRSADARRARRRRDDGRDRAARQQRDARLLPGSRGHRGGLRGRLVPHRGPRRHAPGRLHPAQGPGEGHHHLRRREHLDRRGGAGHRLPPGGADVAVVGVPHEKWGERPEAFVSAAAPVRSGRGIRAHTRGLLAGYKVPDIPFPTDCRAPPPARS